jgi:hypothetical protein
VAGFPEGPRVCKRLKRRIKQLGLQGFDAYRKRLAADPKEWAAIDELCHITISRFFRDSSVFEALSERVLPEIAARAVADQRPARFCQPDAPQAKSHTHSKSSGTSPLRAIFPA